MSIWKDPKVEVPETDEDLTCYVDDEFLTCHYDNYGKYFISNFNCCVVEVIKWTYTQDLIKQAGE